MIQAEIEQSQVIKIEPIKIPESIEVLKPMPCIVVNAMIKDANGHIFLKEGTQLYSGVTGQKVGMLKNRLRFPFDREKLVTNLSNRKLSITKDKALIGEGLNFSRAQQPDFVHFLNFAKMQKENN